MYKIYHFGNDREYSPFPFYKPPILGAFLSEKVAFKHLFNMKMSDILKRDSSRGGVTMTCYVTRIATVEIPVTDIEKSATWYAKTLNLAVQHKTSHEAMLSFNAKGVAGIYLVKTEEPTRLQFVNTTTSVKHSVIDFYTYNLEGFYEQLQANGVEVGKLTIQNGFGGFGFKDPDGNLLGATNIVQLGQE